MDYKKILFVSPNYKRKGGIASVVSEYKKYTGPNFRYFSSIDSSNKVFNMLFFPIKILYFIIYLLINRDIKIVHIHGASRGSFYRKYVIFLISKYFFDKKVIYHIHGGEYHLFVQEVFPIIKKNIRNFIKNTDTLIVLSKQWELFFSNMFKSKSIEVVNNIVPLPNIKEKNKNRVALVRLLFLGKIDKGKGIFDVLESVKKNKELFENKIKIIVGGDGEVDMLKRIILEDHLSNIVEYVGWVTGEKKNLLFLESDIMLLPSYNEGLPISLLEALSYKMPLISTHVGGISEILEHKKNGFVVEAGNIDQITESLRFYLENKSLIKLHGDNSYRIANKYFPEFVFNQLDKIYKDLLDEC